ncbi:clasp N terminal-domain-containing protein [Mucor mucedo]|uniref:clasp N terminal-domain-containing protein n=1 Tax=Mucor mucedo TaxID=29922 RepID=UPI00221F960A|nr:clasp N terminal-domain-containing protein [Mucor mucedo]KAI7896012.1 clasp N terminal-domain-containing protein [Mucor mucedo]
MSRPLKERVAKITSMKDVEKQYSMIPKLFKEKETDSNWEGRLEVFKNLREILRCSELLSEHKEDISAGLCKELPGLVQAVQSLRSSVGIEALAFLTELSKKLGQTLDQRTVVVIVDAMLKCSVSTKKLTMLKLAEASEEFYKSTNFHLSVLFKLCKTRTDKSVQLRQYACTNIKIILETHASKKHVKRIIDTTTGLSTIEAFLKTGLSDASPIVRESCRVLFKTYNKLWPDNAGTLCQSLDSATQKQLQKTVPVLRSVRASTASPNTRTGSQTPSPTTSKVLLKTKTPSPTTSKENIPRPKTPSPTGSNLLANSKTPSPTTSKAPSPTTSKRIVLRPKTPSPTTPNLLPKPKTPSPTTSKLLLKRRTPSPILSRAAMKPTVAIKAAKEAKEAKEAKAAEATKEMNKSAEEASLLLGMLKNDDPQVQCNGLKILASRLKTVEYSPTSAGTNLPANVPNKMDLLNILMDLLTRNDRDRAVYEALMGWESIAGIFMYIMAFNYYCPTLVIAAHQRLEKPAKITEINQIYSKGLKRVKMFLKRNDPLLAKRLLDMLESLKGDQKLLDASVKQDFLLNPSYKQALQCGLLAWMNEILGDYVGLAEDEDPETLKEGEGFLDVVNGGSCAEEWFDSSQNIQSYVAFVIGSLLDTSSLEESYPLLCSMAQKLKLANPRVFANETVNSENQVRIETALMPPVITDKKPLARSAPFDDDLHVEKKRRQISA